MNENSSNEEAREGVLLEHSNTLYSEEIFSIKGFPVTNALMTSWIAVILIILVSLFLRKKMREVPGKVQHVFELIIEGALNLCDQVTGRRKLSMKIFPIVISLFFFILFNNWIGLLPFSAVGIDDNGVFVPLLRSGTADLNTTLGLGLFAVIGSNIFGILSLGIWKTLNKYLNIKVLLQMFKKVRRDKTAIIVAPIQFFVGLIEIIGEMAKIASLSFRLFGNVFAGEILLVSMSAIFAYAVPLPFLFLELLVGLVQAVVFSMLTLVYFTISAMEHGHEEREEAEHIQHIQTEAKRV